MSPRSLTLVVAFLSTTLSHSEVSSGGHAPLEPPRGSFGSVGVRGGTELRGGLSPEWDKFWRKKRKKKAAEDSTWISSTEDGGCSLKGSIDNSLSEGIRFELHHPLYSAESYITPKVVYQVYLHFNMEASVKYFIRSPSLSLTPLINKTQNAFCRAVDGIGGTSGPKDSFVFEAQLQNPHPEYIALELVTARSQGLHSSQSLIRRVVSDCELNLSSDVKEINLSSENLLSLLINSSSCKFYFPRGSDYKLSLRTCTHPLTGSYISMGQQETLRLPCRQKLSLLQVSSLELNLRQGEDFTLSLKKIYSSECPESDPLTIRNVPSRGTLSLHPGCRILFHPDFGHKVRLRTLTSQDHCPYRSLDGSGSPSSSSLSIPTCSFESSDNHVIIEGAYLARLNYEIVLDPQITCSSINGGTVSPNGRLCVKLVNNKMPYLEAQKQCRSLGGGLLRMANTIKVLTWIHFLAQKSYGWKDEHGIWIHSSGPKISSLQSTCTELILARNQTNGIKYFRQSGAPCVKSNWFICSAYKASNPQEHPGETNCPRDITFTSGREAAAMSFGSPNYPQIYPANVNCSFFLRVPPGYGIKVEFERFNLESSENGLCVYDYLSIGSHWKRCGAFRWKYFEFNASNLEVSFVSDYSNEFNGYIAKASAFKLSSDSVQGPTFNQGSNWVEVPFKSDCYNRTLTNMSGEFVLSASPWDDECFLIISAPTDHRVILNLPTTLPGVNCSLQPLTIHFSSHESLSWCPSSTNTLDNFFLSYTSTLIITYKNLLSKDSHPFPSFPSIIGSYHLEHFQLQHLHPEIFIFENNVTEIRNVNFPLLPPHNLVLVTKLRSKPGLNIELTVFGNVVQRNENCTDSYLEIEDLYQNSSRSWKFCRHGGKESFSSEGILFKDKSQHRIRSYFNVLILRQVTSKHRNDLEFGILAHGSLDPHLRRKVSQLPETKICDDNLCFNGGYCNGFTSRECLCPGHFVGQHCLENACFNITCLNGGSCSLSQTGFFCVCPKSQFGGRFCQKKLHPCESNPCGGRGICQSKKEGTFRCQCHLWWTGPRCDRRMKHIPFKPITKRMLEEPFWLGLITVVIVLNILGIGWFIKKHLSDRIERFLFSDDLDSKRSPLVKNIDAPSGTTGSHSHPYDLTPQNSNSSDWLDGPPCSMETSPTLANPLGCSASGSKSIFGRLSIRKTSILSFSSNTSSPVNGEKKHFSSQEEIFSKRSPSPHYRLSNASTVSAEEKRLILKKLISPQSRANSENSFTSLMIKTTRSAESIVERANSVSGPILTTTGGGTNTLHSMDGYRKDSALSLQIPVTVFGGVAAATASKKVTFSRVVDQMACSLSGSSSLSDISSLDLDMRRQGSLIKSRKLVRSNRITTSKPPSFAATKKAAQKTRSLPGSYGVTSASEDVPESSIESIDFCSPSISKEPRKHSNRLLKISSADSLISMIRSLTVNRNAISTPSSPQLSNEGPDWVREEAALNPETLRSPGNSRHGSLKLHRDSSLPHQIQVDIVNQPPDKKDPSAPVSGGATPCSSASTSPTNVSQSITLEVPNFHYGGLLSPIKELPSPLPTPLQTPIPSPLPHHRPVAGGSRRNSSAGGEAMAMGIRRSSPRRYSSAAVEEETTSFMNPTTVPPIVVTSHCDDDSEPQVLVGGEQDPIVIMTVTASPQMLKDSIHPAIIISSPNSDEDLEEDGSVNTKKRPRKFARPLIKQQGVEFPFDSTPRSRSQSIEIKGTEGDPGKEWSQVTIGSPPVKRATEGKGLLPLNLIGKAAPIITITPSNDSSAEDKASSGRHPPLHHPGYGIKALNNNYLSPYSQLAADYGSIRTTSDSNLSSSGYSSMASPCPSRSGSLNPLSEVEEHFGHPRGFKRATPLRKGMSVDSESSETHPLEDGEAGKTLQQFIHDRRMSFIRTDSETTDEMFLSESLQTELTNLPLDESISSLNTSDIPTIILGHEDEAALHIEKKGFFTIPNIEIEPSTPISFSPPASPPPPQMDEPVELDHSDSLQNVSSYFNSNNYFGSKSGLHRNCSSTGCLSDFNESRIPGGSRYKRLNNEVPQVVSLDSSKLSASKAGRRKYLSEGRRVVSEGKIDVSSSDESLHSNNSSQTWDGRLAPDSFPSSSDETDSSNTDTITNSSSIKTSSSSSPASISNSPLEQKSSLLPVPKLKKQRNKMKKKKRRVGRTLKSSSNEDNPSVTVT